MPAAAADPLLKLLSTECTKTSAEIWVLCLSLLAPKRIQVRKKNIRRPIVGLLTGYQINQEYETFIHLALTLKRQTSILPDLRRVPSLASGQRPAACTADHSHASPPFGTFSFSHRSHLPIPPNMARPAKVGLPVACNKRYAKHAGLCTSRLTEQRYPQRFARRQSLSFGSGPRTLVFPPPRTRFR
jgi:hypothetical protein